nr:hypothetical protein [Limimaricola cinnabarinus]
MEKRKLIKQSLYTDSKTEAEAIKGKIRQEILVELDRRLAGDKATADPSFDNVVALAKARGVAYRTSAELAAGPASELMGRLKKLMTEDPSATRQELISAELGGIDRPQVLISDLLREYEETNRARLSRKNDDQLRRWRNPYKRAINDLRSVLPNKQAVEITRQEALQLEAIYLDRVAEGEILAATANKRLGHLRTLVRAHCKRHQLIDNTSFENLSVSGGREPRKRKECSEAWILENILSPSLLSRTNSEIRDVLIIMSETGASPSEITGALPNHFRLNDPIPHIELRQEGRDLKNKYRVRDLVLTRPALEAARRHPEGFPRYRGKPGFSDAANGFLRENKLLPTPEHTVYSLRHAFQGRLRRAGGIDQFYQARMMGHDPKHVIKREVYGDDLTLEERMAVMNIIRLDTSEEERRKAKAALMGSTRS